MNEAVNQAVADIAARVRAAGGRAWKVGGCVRDAVLGLGEVKDIDLEVFGLLPDQLEALLAEKYRFDPCGISFGILKLQHLDIDVAIPRRESKRGEGHRGFSVSSDPFLSVREAASRRDFTINAIYEDPLTGEREDPFGGIPDLKGRVLRHVSEKFGEDPLRVLRGMQFVARFNLTPAPETIAVCRQMTMEGLARERLFEEWAKMLEKGVAMSAALDFLRATGWLSYFPELGRLVGCPQDPKWHPEGDVWEHTKRCLDAFARHRIGDKFEDVLVGFAVVCHDFGKPDTTYKDRVTGRWRSPGHDEAGATPTRQFLERLTNEERLLKEIPPLVACHMAPFSLWRGHAGDAAVRRLANRVGRIDRLVRVSEADDEGRILLSEDPNRGLERKWLLEMAERLQLASSRPQPIFLGRHLMALGYRPSPQFKKWLNAVFEAQLDGRFTNLAGAENYFKTQIAPH